MLKRCLTPLFVGAVMGAAVISGAGAAVADDTWNPIGANDIYTHNSNLVAAWRRGMTLRVGRAASFHTNRSVRSNLVTSMRP